MTFTERVKEEIISKKISQPCCQVSALSAFIRGAGTLLIKKGYIGFEVITENKKAIDTFSQILTKLYGANSTVNEVKDKLKGKTKYSLSLVSEKSTLILQELGIIEEGASGAQINLNVDKYLIENDCCKKSYLIGAFIGSGSLTVPSEKSTTSYHFELVFSKYQTASCVAELLSEVGFMPKLTERKESYVIYFKNGDEISDILFYLGAKKACFELKEIIIEKVMKNNTNRKMNCDMGNINKQVEASLKQVKDINLIIETVGLDKLPPTLKQACTLRLENTDSTLEEMSKLSGLSKSCLNHRFRKIAEIAKNL